MCCHLSHSFYLQKDLVIQWHKSGGSEYEAGVQVLAQDHGSWQMAFTYFTRISEPNAVWENLKFFELYKNILWKTSQEKSGDASRAPECITSESGSFCSSSVIILSLVCSSPSSLSCPCRSKILKQGLKYLGKWLKRDREGGVKLTHNRKPPSTVCCMLEVLACWLWALLNWNQLLSKWVPERDLKPQLLPVALLCQLSMSYWVDVGFFVLCSFSVFLLPLQLHTLFPTSRESDRIPVQLGSSSWALLGSWSANQNVIAAEEQRRNSWSFSCP